MSKTKSYENGIKSMITQIKNQIHQFLRQNRLQILKVRKFDFSQIYFLLDLIIEKVMKTNQHPREKQTKRRFTLQPLRNNASNKELPRQDQIQNKKRLFKKKKLEIKAWTISTTNPTDQ
ncbi:unnamed protein product [Paramecium pentaurelia]|uniref:Uncharacterized protein n=1 Tax=Paramecium pentaurelia TaxID=43138 RepID=A0A8S1WS02_9CILI|nr:unnamed protein product [Paramecium pentaurelia]